MNFNFKIILLLVLPYVSKVTYGYSQATSSSSGSLETPSLTFHNNKIVGGKPAKQSQFPYQLSLRKYGRHICGASLIKVDDVSLGVTAAHCVDDGVSYPIMGYSVVAGDLKFSDTSGSEQTRRVAKIVVHEEYDSWEFFNDIALLFFVGSPFQVNDDVKNIDLPDENEETFGNVTVSGWGRLAGGGGSLPDTLQYIEMPVVNQTVCQDKWGSLVEIGDGILCSGVDSGEMSPCNGDSGGPAKSKDGGYLAGIVAFGPSSCAHPDYPAAFTKVAHYIKWIYEQVGLFNENA